MTGRDFESWWTTVVIDNPKKSVLIAFVLGGAAVLAVGLIV